MTFLYWTFCFLICDYAIPIIALDWGKMALLKYVTVDDKFWKLEARIFTAP